MTERNGVNRPLATYKYFKNIIFLKYTCSNPNLHD